jgi:uncharacterized membrane protein
MVDTSREHITTTSAREAADWEKVLPGSAQRILAMAEQAQAQQFALAQQGLSADVRLAIFSRLAFFVVVLLIVTTAAFLGYRGEETAAAAWASPLATLGGAYIWVGRRRST